MKLTPCAKPKSSCAWASASLVCSPKVIVPRQMSGTTKLEPPSGRRLSWVMRPPVSGLGAEYAVNQDGAVENHIVTNRYDGQMVIPRVCVVRDHPLARGQKGSVERVENGIQSGGAYRMQLSRQAVEQAVGIQPLDGIASRWPGQGEGGDVEAVTESIGGKRDCQHA